MKKLRIIIPTVLLIIVIGLLSAYFIYGSTLIDITSEKSISNHLAADPDQPITIIKTAKNGNYFGILYSDPVDEDDGYYHFRYITKATFYSNKYHNFGGNTTSINDPEIAYDILNSVGEDERNVETFLYTFNSNLFENNKCSVFECYAKDSEIAFEEITDEKQIIEKMQKLADSYKKIDEFELPNEDIYIIPKNYELSQSDNEISFVNGSVSVEDMKKQTMNQAESMVKEYREYVKEAKQWKKY